MRGFFLLFLIVPIVEMLLLFEVSNHIGALSTVGLVLLTAVIGVQVLRQQGFSTLTRANQKMAAGQLPAQEMLEGIFLAVGGASLLTPGFITDTLGFLCLIGPVRRLMVQKIIRSGKITVAGAGFQSSHFHTRRGPGQGPSGADIYEGEFTREQPPGRQIEPDDNER